MLQKLAKVGKNFCKLLERLCYFISARCNIYISRLCYDASVLCPSVCDVCALWSQGAMDPGYLCMLGYMDVFSTY